MPVVTVIIPTLGTRPRELDRAISSALLQQNASVTVLVVINGDRCAPDLPYRLQCIDGVQLLHVREAGVSRARLEGRRQVDTPFFAFLDDDDELLPNAMEIRLRAHSQAKAAVVATNGYCDWDGVREINFPHFPGSSADPVQALLEENWLASAGGLYRTERVLPDDLEVLPNYLEMTYLAFKLAVRDPIILINTPTFVIHMGAAHQASLSSNYHNETPNVLAAMENLTSSRELRQRLQRKRSAALHTCSLAALQDGDLRTAWRHHLASLKLVGGLRYLTYTRHLLTPHRTSLALARAKQFHDGGDQP